MTIYSNFLKDCFFKLWIVLARSSLAFKTTVIIVKRGCSEFANSYPDYKVIDTKSKYFLNYKDEWIEKEKIVNEFYPKNISKELNPHETLKGNSLNDMIIIKNWIDYAQSINDLSYKKLI